MASYAYKALEQYNSESQIHNEIMKITSKKSSRAGDQGAHKVKYNPFGKSMCLCTYWDTQEGHIHTCIVCYFHYNIDIKYLNFGLVLW